MKKIIDVNLEEHKCGFDKITVTLKNIPTDSNTIIKCFKNYDEIISLEARKINLLKIQKTIFLNLSYIQHIDLRDNKILKISKNFKMLKSLRSLRLDDNCISYLPNFIGHMNKLEVLTLSNNKITYLPTSIQYMQKLKTFKISYNHLTSIPIEMGLLKSLECLHIDSNHFTEIPTTLCYLKHLNELSFEWLEFLDPPFSRVIKDSIGKTIIVLIRNVFQEMIRSNILYCNMLQFIERNSNKKDQDAPLDESEDKHMMTSTNALPIDLNEQPQMEKATDPNVNLSHNQKQSKIFPAIENNYVGVINSLITSNEEYLKTKNVDNKTPLYFSIHCNKVDVTNLILSKIDLHTISNSHTYLHKAIRMRDPVLVAKLLEMGVDTNQVDDQGSSSFHVLFSAFTKQLSKCALIGDLLLRKGTKLNVRNNDNWAPVHIAARKSAKECIVWMLKQNKLLSNTYGEIFDLNLYGKNKWTALHLAVNSYRFDETLLFLEAGCDIFKKNSDGKTPRKVTNGNFLLTKLLRNYEINALSKRYSSDKPGQQNGQNYFTTVPDISNVTENSIRDEPNRPLAGSIISQEKTVCPIPIPIPKLSIPKGVSSKTNKGVSEHKTLEKSRSGSNFYRPEYTKAVPKVNRKQSFSKLSKNKSKSKISLIPNASIIPHKGVNTKNENNALRESIKVNLHFHKEIILNSETTIAEKYESLMWVKQSAYSKDNDVEVVIKSIIEGINLDSEVNVAIFSDICSILIINQFFNLIPFLEVILRSLHVGNTHKNIFFHKELANTIEILKIVKDSLKITNDHNFKKPLSKALKKRPNGLERKKSSPIMIMNRSVNKFPGMKGINRYFETDNSKKENENYPNSDEFNYEEMNEVSKSEIDIRQCNEIKKANREIENSRNDNFDIESCNVPDSSISMVRWDAPLTSKNSNYTIRIDENFTKPDEDIYSIIPSKHIDSSFFDIENID